MNGERKTACRTLIEKSEGKRQLGRSRCMCMDNIKIDIREKEWVVVDWIDLTRDRDRWKVLVNTAMNLWVP
jgi:hypothetical protein